MSEVVISDGSVTLRIHSVADPIDDGYRYWNFQVSLASEGLSATTPVVDASGSTRPMPLVAYFEDVAASWRGWDGAKSYRALETQFALEASYHGFGRVHLVAELADPGSAPGDTWTSRGLVVVDPGEQMRSIATDLKALFGQP